jgi:hypothetical protein
MYPLDQLTNATQPVTLAGRVFPVRQLKLREWGELQSWLKSVAPSPIAVATKGLAELRVQGVPVPPDVQDALFRQAQEETRRWPPRVGTAAWLRALEDIDGGRVRFLQVAVASGGTTLSDDEAADIEDAATLEELGDLMRVCLHGEHLVPKAAGETTPPSPTTGESGTKTFETAPDGPTATSAN